MAEETRLIHAGLEAARDSSDVETVGPAIQKGSTVLLPNAAALYDDDHFVTYGRQGLGVHEALRSALCDLEHAKAVEIYPSGVAALTGAMLAVLKAGDAIAVVDNIYKPTRRFCDQVLANYGVTVRYFHPAATPEEVIAAGGAALRLIVLESPGSLSFEMQDLAAFARAARQRGILTLADNTWGAGWLYRPLDHGVDIAVQALTKYVGGHSDVFMGSAATCDPKLARILRQGHLNLGWACAPEDAYAMLRGLRTLPTRLARHGESGLEVARWLAGQSEVIRVIHPALPDDPNHALWKRDYSGACGLFGFVLRPASETAVDAFLDALEVFGLGFSWGGFESLAISCDHQLRNRASRPDYGGPLMRLHVGLEAPADLIADLRRGLDAFAAAA